MNTAELDAFFARADDVLTDWDGSVDSAHARKGAYYESGLTTRQAQALLDFSNEIQQMLDAMRIVIAEVGRQMQAITRSLNKVQYPSPKVTS